MRTWLIKVLLLFVVSSTLRADEEAHSINFHNVNVEEFIRFVSKVSNVNFIYDHKELQFPVSLTSGKPMTSENILAALIEMLRVRGYFVMQKDGYYVIHRNELAQLADEAETANFYPPSAEKPFPARSQREFMVYKLQYQQGGDVESAIKKIGQDLMNQPNESPALVKTIQSVQWVKATNSILASGDEASLASLKRLIESIDAPLKQVFIEVLVIETDVRGSLDFGLEWAAEGGDSKVTGRMGNFSPKSSLGKNNLAAGIAQIPLHAGFNLGVIGNMLLHKGKSYLSLGSLVSALQVDGDSTIVLNQKIITQDNKNSKIFVGDNIPFTGSVIQTVGASEQTTSNIEYRDVGVSLSITPMLGDDDIITLEIQQEITEALPDLGSHPNSLSSVGGIRTTKTDMSTQVHVPDRHFLVLTGMMRNHSSKRVSKIPCLGGLPLIGAAFSKKNRNDDKKNVIIYVRPQIVHSIEEFKKITQTQEGIVRRESAPLEFDRALNATKESP